MLVSHFFNFYPLSLKVTVINNHCLYLHSKHYDLSTKVFRVQTMASQLHNTA